MFNSEGRHIRKRITAVALAAAITTGLGAVQIMSNVVSARESETVIIHGEGGGEQQGIWGLAEGKLKFVFDNLDAAKNINEQKLNVAKI